MTTSIEWCKNPDGTQGITWNPLSGCNNHTPEGLCLDGLFPCYAWKLAHTRLKQRYLNRQIFPIGQFDDAFYRDKPLTDPFYPRFWEERVDEIWKLGRSRCAKAKGIFTCDMSDLFGIGIPEEWTRAILDAISHASPHRFYLLTKQAQNLIKFSPFPKNCWVGVTATNQESYYDGVSSIAGVEAKIKFVSFEPLLAQINGGECAEEYRLDSIEEFDWVIVGACTGSLKEMLALGLKDEFPDKRVLRWGKKWTLQPRIEWVREIVEAADKAGVKVFLKNNLKPLIDANCPDESDLVPNHDRLFRMRRPNLCVDCAGKYCHECGVIWGLRQEMPE
jgi:protein gp37